MNPLEKIIIQHIIQHGPMDIGQFMTMALGHHNHGYYMKQDPFGRTGDFVTAPEVSQMFGEVLGAWVAHSWMQMGAPERFVLLECGPGRGTLMADMLRATSNVSGFHEAVDVCLLEMSPALREKQAETLRNYKPRWFECLEDVPKALPIIIVANEFLDALPFRQLIKGENGWLERIVGVDGDQFIFGIRDVDASMAPQEKADEGDIYEFSLARESFVLTLCARMKENTGAALLIDYGHESTALGDTFQGVNKHEYVSVLTDVGDVDLTSHVDFEPLVRVAKDSDCAVQPLMEQGNFLKMLGIEQRAAYLRDKGAQNIEKDLHRLTDHDEMGRLFKVMDMRYGF